MSQRMTLSQRYALLQSTVQQMTATISILRASCPNNFEECIPNVLGHIVELASRQLSDPQIASGLESLFATRSFQLALAHEAENLALANRPACRDFALYLVENSLEKDSASRVIVPKSANPSRNSKLNMDATTHAKFREAFYNPAKMAQAVQEQKLLAQDRMGSGVGAVQDISEMQIALRAQKLFGKHWLALESLMRFAFTLREPSREGLLCGFLREHVVLSKLDYVLSLRIQKRFASRFDDAGKNAQARHFQDAMINSIGEFVLVSLGIITPEIFHLQSFEFDEVAEAFAQQSFDDCDEDNDELPENVRGFEFSRWMKRYYLKSEGRIFWNRWAMAGRKPTRYTDQLVRDFIRQTVAKHADQLLETINFPEVFKRCKEINAEATESDDDDEDATEALLGEVLADALDADSFREVLQAHMRGDWYQKLQMFWREQED